MQSGWPILQRSAPGAPRRRAKPRARSGFAPARRGRSRGPDPAAFRASWTLPHSV